MTYPTQTQEDWKLQASIKVGPKNDRGEPLHMINVRAVTVDELVTLMDKLNGVSGFMSLAIDLITGTASNETTPQDPAAQALATLQQNGFPQTQQIQPGVITPQPQAQPQTFGQPPAPPQCQHGPMKYYAGNNKNGQPFRAYFCSGPKGPNQCQPKFLD